MARGGLLIRSSAPHQISRYVSLLNLGCPFKQPEQARIAIELRDDVIFDKALTPQDLHSPVSNSGDHF